MSSLAVSCAGTSPVDDRDRSSTEARREPPVAVALVQERGASALVVIDLPHFEIVNRIRLRSLCLSMDGDVPSRTIVTAQCGGPDREADDACGIVSLSEPCEPRYVKLPVPNPTSVAVAGGRAYLLHGFEQTQGACVSVVDPARARLVDNGHITRRALRPEAVGEHVLLAFAGDSGTGAPGGVGRLVEASRIETLSVFDADTVCVIADPMRKSSRTWAASRSSDRGELEVEWRVREVAGDEGGPKQGALRERRVDGVRKGVFQACRVGESLVLCDADGLDLRDPGRQLLWLDANTLAELGRFALEGSPAAVAAWGKRLLVFDGQTNELIEFAEGGLVPARRLPLGGEGLGCGDLAVFP